MHLLRSSSVLAYAVAVLLVAATTLFRAVLQQSAVDLAPFGIYFPAVVVATMLGGVGPGIVASLGSAAMGWWPILPPPLLRVTPITSDLRLPIFLVLAIFLVAVVALLRGALAATRASGTALRESEERLRLAVEATELGTWDIDLVARRFAWSDHYRSMLGAPPDMPASQENFDALVDPDDLPEIRAVQRRMRDPASSGAYRAEFRTRALVDGAPRRILSIGRVTYDAAGRPLRIVGTSVDVTRRRQAEQIAEREQVASVYKASEERYRTLYNRTPMALHSVDAAARIIDVNDSWLQLFGYERDEVLGHSPAEFMTEDSARLYRENAWPDMLASRGATRSFEYRMVKRSGEVFDGRISSQGESDAEGSFVRTWAATADITAQKQAEAQLRQAQRIEAVGRLTSGVAHDFNNLLTAIIGNIELLQNRLVGDERSQQLIRSAQKAAERGARLTAQLLAFSRQQRMALEPLDLNRVIAGMSDMLQSTIAPTTAIVTALADEPWPALADATQVELVILNLIINARDAMPGGGVVTIATANVTTAAPIRAEEPPAGDHVMIAVSDTGTGIPVEIIDRVFEPFFTTKGIGKGSGLGLPQVVGVAQQLGGGVRIVTEPGRGTTVEVYLPRATNVGREAAKAVPSPIAVEVPPRRGARRLTVLLVDDDEDVRSITAAMLREIGHEVSEAANGEAALAEVERAGDRIDLLVVDFAMPGMNGVEVARNARHRRPGLPVLFVTGFADTAVLAADATPDEILQKPFHRNDLTAKVERLAAVRGKTLADVVPLRPIRTSAAPTRSG